MENRYLDKYENKDLGTLLRGAAELPAIRVELAAPTPAAPPQPTDGATSEMLGVFRRHAFHVFGIAVLCGAVSYLITLPQRPMYRAETSLEIQSPNENFLNIKDFDPASAGAGDSYVEAQVKVLRGDELLTRTAAKLNIERRPDLWRATSFVSAWKARLGLDKSAAMPPHD